MFENPNRGRQAINSRSQIVFRTDILPKIVVGCPCYRHRHRRPSRLFSHHLSHYRGSSWKFILIKVSFGFALYLHNTKTKMTKLKKSCGFLFLTFAYKIKNSFIANKKLTTLIKHHNVTQRSVVCFFVIFPIFDVAVVQYVSAFIHPLIVSLIRYSRIITIAIIFRHRGYRRPSRLFSNHLSHYRGSSYRFI